MASSMVTMKKCATCIVNSDELKAKPGITSCAGCYQSFCLSHFNEHRQTLNDTLDSIALQRDALRSRIQELPANVSKEYLKVIDDWENTMLQKVTEAANNARQQNHQLIISEMERECGELTSKITSFRHNDNYFETDLQELQSTTEKLNENLNDLSSLHHIQLNLPTLDCSNMIHIKSIETHPLPEITKSNDSSMVKSKKEYSSFIERFLTTQQPSTNITTETQGYVCASSSMLIYVDNRRLYIFFFRRGSTSELEWKGSPVLDVQWSKQLQHFLILSSDSLVAVATSAATLQSEEVVPEMEMEWQYMTHWKDLCLMSDSSCRLFLYKMDKNLSTWFLLYCWSPPTTCAPDEEITAIGLNEHYIVLSIQCDDEYRFALYQHDMKHFSNVQLIRPCTTIQALPHGEWLLYDSTQKLYDVIDFELEQHEEPYLSSLKDIKCVVTCDETDKVLVVLLDKRATNRPSTKKQSFPFSVSDPKCDHYNIKTYMNDC
ncbi:unnamed protein product [Didymodactylos carnosus]|uniref:Uncharacterized protein n=1 Tax=Didymodactylos carnosus TaxID=1234261 RepID=A0A8S2FT59_9BILA|nr:unnamed protein product [Didymodactylos carnosus]CAF4337850.1 unnamed protein product [Didymodactylos carnosus]